MEDFDWRYYINRYADLRDAGVVNKKRAFVHWNLFPYDLLSPY